MTSSTREILSFSPPLANEAILQGHRSSLESLGRKLEEKQRSLRSLEILFQAKKADWDEAYEYGQEILANSQTLLVLCEGTAAFLGRALLDLHRNPLGSGEPLSVVLVSSSLSAEALQQLGRSLKGRAVSLLVAFDGLPSTRLTYCFHAVYHALSQGRTQAEMARRVYFTLGTRELSWLNWARSQQHRVLEFAPRACGRYLFPSPFTALLLTVLGEQPWRYIEGARSLFRSFDRQTELEDPIFALAALREVQLSDHFRETLLLPDERFLGFGAWWRDLTEDSRRAFSEEISDGQVGTGRALDWIRDHERPDWTLEIRLSTETDLYVQPLLGGGPDSRVDDLLPAPWSELERHTLQELAPAEAGDLRHGPIPAQLHLRKRDPMSIGALFSTIETLVCASHKLAEVEEEIQHRKPNRRLLEREHTL